VPKAKALGLGVVAITPALRKEFTLDDKVQGALILAVAEDSDAEKIGIAKGDVIAKAGEHAVTGLGDIEAAVAEAKKAGRPSVLCKVWHRGPSGFNAVYVPIKLDK